MGAPTVIKINWWTYLPEKCIHEAVPAFDVDGNILGSNVVVVALGRNEGC
jgi:hypothetical protein